MVTRTATFYKRRYNGYVPAAGYAADVVHAGPLEVNLGTPAASAADNILNDQSLATAGTTTTFLDDEADSQFGRNIRLVASGASTSTVTVRGRDYLGQPMNESLTLNGTTSVVGVKAFYWIDSVTWTATAATTFDMGWGARMGVPYYTVNVLAEQVSGAAGTVGTLTAGVRTDPQTATTVDPRGLYTPNGTVNGTNRFVIVTLVDNFVNLSGNGGLYGIAHFFA